MKTPATILALLCIAAFAQQKGRFKDTRDGKTYNTVKIGEQTWMAENLSYNAKGSKCYDNKKSNFTKYGMLYDYETAKKVCPSGWHLPSNEEWDKLYRLADGTNGTESPYKSETAGKFLKSREGWNDYKGESGNREDKFGFSALPGGYGKSSGYYYKYEDWNSYDKSSLFSVRCVED